MERLNQFAFYELGQTLKQLGSHKGEVQSVTIMNDLFEASRVLTSLLDGVPIQIGVSSASARELMEYVDQMISTTYFAADENTGKRSFRFPPAEQTLPEWQMAYIGTLLQKFETVFQEEMREAAAYFVPRRGIYWTPALVDSADETFPKDLIGAIPDKSKVEWRAAGRCLAFNLLSASGFHVARAVEGAIETYYQTFCNAPGKTLHGWQDYIDCLDKAAKAGGSPAPSAKTLAEIQQMKVDYRNPIMHPRVVLTEADARMLFANGESLIIAMAQELVDAARSGVQTGLALVSPVSAGGAQ